MMLLLLACTPAATDADTASSAGAPAAPTDTGAAEIEVIEGAEGGGQDTAPAVGVSLSPDGGAFSGTVTVAVSGEGALSWCSAPPAQTCALEPYTGPITLQHSAIVHAQQEGGEELARSFVAMDAEALSFTSDVPVVVLWTPDSAPDSDAEVPVGIDVFDAGGQRTDFTAAPADSGRARLRLRGSSTYGLSKPSLDLELWQPDSSADRQAALLGMPEDGDWILYAPYYYDEALIRNSLGYALSNAIGRYAPRTVAVEIFLAEHGQPVDLDDYLGVYILTEEIERGGDRVDVTAIGPEDNDEPEVTGGYVFKRDRAGDDESGFSAGEAGGRFSFGYPLVWVDPSEEERTTAQQLYLSGELDDLAWALVAADHTSPQTQRHYSEIIDVDSFIDHHILNVLFKNPDAFRLSGYMHKDREGPVVAGPLWDLDRTAGANDSRATYPTWWDASNQTSDTTYVFEFGWYGAMFDDPDFSAAYWARWEELLAGELSAESVAARIDAQAAALAEAGARNAARWGAADFDGEIAALKVWMATRTAWIEACIATEEDPRRCSG